MKQLVKLPDVWLIQDTFGRVLNCPRPNNRYGDMVFHDQDFVRLYMPPIGNFVLTLGKAWPGEMDIEDFYLLKKNEDKTS